MNKLNHAVLDLQLKLDLIGLDYNITTECLNLGQQELNLVFKQFSKFCLKINEKRKMPIVKHFDILNAC